MRYFDTVKQKLSALLPMWLMIMLFAIWSVVIQDGHINRDGLLYLKQAYLIAEGSWKEGLDLYPWPFFSILIAIFHKVSGLHLQVVAHAIDLVLFGIAVWFYLKTLKLIYKQQHIIFYGGIILLSFIPIMDDYVGMVLRDHGLWAGCMMGTYFYFKNYKEYSLKNSINWQFGFLFAMFFRPEGLVFLLLLPLWNLTQNKSQKFKKLIEDYSLSIFSVIVGLFTILLLNVDLMNVINSSRLSEFLNRPVLFLNQLVKPLPIQTDNEFLSDLFENYSLIITYAVLLSVLIFKWIKGLGVLHGGLFFYFFFAKKRPLNDYQKHIFFFLIVSFILVSINLFNVYVLTNRYWGFHWWWIFVLLAPIFHNFLENKKSYRLLRYAIYFVLILSILNVIIDSAKRDEQDVAEYINNKQIKNIDFNDNIRIQYYIDKSVANLIGKPYLTMFEYSLIKVDKNYNFNNGFIVKTFPKHNPKFILIKK
jgi:hypothetical protein